jgi:putative ABC transport system ATP-binding protein
MISLKDISVVFGKNTSLENIVLNSINLEIATGDFITLIGSNGAGKSTLLKLISGDIVPVRGKIFFDNKEVTHLTVEQRAKYIGHVYQDPRLGTCEGLTVEENLAFAASRGKKRSLKLALNRRNRHRFKSLLTKLNLGLEERLTDQASLLSGGQRQALSLVMATLQSPKILLLDEHTAALDPKTAKAILAITQEIVKQSHLTTVMITHHMSHALEVGNRTLLMQEGKIEKDLTGVQRKSLKPEDLVSYF